MKIVLKRVLLSKRTTVPDLKEGHMTREFSRPSSVDNLSDLRKLYSLVLIS
jgi:hypothetical protein